MASKAKKARQTNFESIWNSNPMKKPYLEKIILNIGVGAGGEELERAATVLGQISERKPIKTLSKVKQKYCMLYLKKEASSLNL